MTTEQQRVIKEAQDQAEKLLKDNKAFDRIFEEIFKKFDTNGDGSIGAGEYVEFLKIMLTTAGQKNYSLPNAMLRFDHADKDGDGNIDKEEFKREVLKRLRDFVGRKS